MDVNKKVDLEFIKSFSKINVTQICRELNIDRPNLMKGKASSETTRKVREEIEKRLDELKS